MTPSGRTVSPVPPASRSASTRVAPGTLAGAAICVGLIFGAGYLRTHEAAERLTRVSSRPHPVNTAEVQQVLDMARFTTAPSPSVPSTRPVDAPLILAVPVAPPAGTGGASAAARTAHALPPASGTVAPPAAPAAPSTTLVDPTAPEPTASTAAALEPPAAAAAVPAADSPGGAGPAPAPAPLHDGTFVGWGYCRHGEIQATLIVEHGRITSAEITQCQTRYSCDWIAKLPPQVVSRQSAEVDYVSGASESADAFYFAVEEALKKAR